jgi:hypothetical protein
MKTFSSVVIATLTMVGMASAQPKAADPKAPATPAKGAPATPATPATPAKDAKAAPATTAAPAMPTPVAPAEIKEMLKAQAGTWKCTGTGMGAAMKATMKSKADLDGFWIQDAFEGTMGKTKFKFVAFTTFDGASKKWRRVMVDNMGGQAMGTSDGLKDGKVTFNMDVMGMGQTGMMKDTVDMTDKKLIKSSGEMSMDKGKTWNPTYEMTCKK